jgi:biopolymer transport protein ExbB
MVRTLPLLALVACASPSQGVAIDRVVPDRADVGVMQPVTIEGTFKLVTTNLDEGDTTTGLVTAAIDTMPLGDATWMAQDRISATMPGLPEGIYDVTVAIDGRSDTLTGGYIVGNPVGSDGGNPAGPTTHAVLITGPITGGPHIDFPLLVDLADSKLRTTGSGGEVAHPMGFDISFSLDAANTMPLAHEIEKYDGTAGELVAWVKIPSLDTSTTLFIHMGDAAITTDVSTPTAVWTAGFGAVFHLTDRVDSTANANNGTETSTQPDPDGQIEIARAFNGTTSHITVPAAPSINNVFAAGGTVAVWMFVESPGQGSLGRVFEKATVLRLGNCDGAGVTGSVFFTQEFTGGPATWCTPANTLPTGAWTHVTVMYDKSSTANDPAIYINGTLRAANQVQTPNGSSFNDSVGSLLLGDSPGGGRAFDGRIDELSFANVLRTDGWIRTTFDNQNDPNTFVMLGP